MLRPLLHFLWIGTALFAVDRLWLREPPAPAPVIVPAARVAELRTAFLARSGRMPDADELSVLVRSEVDDELLYREALAAGFDRDDPVVQRRLVQNMRFAGADPERDDASLYAEALELGMDRSDPVVRRRLVQRMRLAIEAEAMTDEPGETELRARYDAERARFVDPTRVRLVQLYFDGEPAGEAARALGELRARGAGPDDTGELGEAFLHGVRQPLQSERELAARFGADFGAAALALPVGEWSGPVTSSYGEHLVHVVERVPAAQRPFEAVRDDLRHALLAERRRLALAEVLAELRRGVRVVVPDGAGLSP
ncbi:MAG: peptidyl-prolyl cis-trans isomerase [Myxococcota bacterium]